MVLLVDGLSFSNSSSSSSPSQGEGDGREMLTSLLEYTYLVSSSDILKATPVRKVTISEESLPMKHVYVFQSEYATVNPSLVQVVGTDCLTTSVGLVIRNRQSGMTSIGQLAIVEVVDTGLSQMLALVVGNEVEATLDVHLIGGFEDETHKDVDNNAVSKTSENVDGYSMPLCAKIIDALQNRREKFLLQTLCVLRHNTKRDSSGNNFPIISGFLVETASGSIVPATFDISSRCPDEIVRRIRIFVSHEDPSWEGKLLETYDTSQDRFCIAPCAWKYADCRERALSLLQLSDSEFLSEFSTSPSAEEPDFVENHKRALGYLIEYPYWSQTFVRSRPRTFGRTSNGGWQKIE